VMVDRAPLQTGEGMTEHITVCICTYKRPQLLSRLLKAMDSQVTEGRFTYSIVVADNDMLRSAEPVVAARVNSSCVTTSYCVEPERGIALARNRAMANTRGEYIAFIDDDEFPICNWLLALFRACEQWQADGVMGPTKPYYEELPPQWVVKARLHERAAWADGHVMDWFNSKTGNVIFKRKILDPGETAFRPEFLTGEDQDFFRRMIEKGRVFVWCNEAVAYEVVPPARWQLSYLFRKGLLRGKIRLLHRNVPRAEVAKSAIALLVYGLALPFLFLAGRHHFMKYLIKTFDHVGRLVAFLGLDLVREAYVSE
jgi:succinoglycan biosynthesis protein ExoM